MAGWQEKEGAPENMVMAGSAVPVLVARCEAASVVFFGQTSFL
jgi:hypothetical protein